MHNKKQPLAQLAKHSKPKGEKPTLFAQFTLYNYRYKVGYIIFLTLLLVGTIFFAFHLPNDGLTAEEIDSVTASANLGFDSFKDGSLTIANLPFHALQKAFITIFGATIFAMRLPSLILAILVGLLFERLLIRLFRDNIAVITSAIAVSATLFLTIAHLATPITMNLLIMLLLSHLVTDIIQNSKRKTFSCLVLFIAGVLSCAYIPLYFIFLLPLILLFIIHPKFRAPLKSVNKTSLIIAVSISIVLLIPFIFSISTNFVNTVKSLVDFTGWHFGDFSIQLYTIFNVGGVVTPYSAPIIGWAIWGLALYGIVRCFIDMQSARARALLSWFTIVILVFAFNPGTLYLLFIPIILLCAVGLDALLTSWNRFFPLNPYARLVGLSSACILVFIVVYSSIWQYSAAALYDANTVHAFNQTTAKVLYIAHEEPDARFLVALSEQPFYELLDINVTTVPDTCPLYATSLGLGANNQSLAGKIPDSIIPSRLKDAPVLTFYGECDIM